MCVHGFLAGDLLAAIERDFGSFDNFKSQLSSKTVAIQGSGWGWLVSCPIVCAENFVKVLVCLYYQSYNKERGKLDIAICSNQDPLQATTG